MENMPPGFRFYPTEEELVSFYLHHKLERQREDLNLLIDRVIPTVDIYGFNPWDLPKFSWSLCHKDLEQWFFFVPRQESEAKGGRPSRLTTTGYWKATGSPGFIYSGNRPIGEKRTMVFYKGRAPNGRKTEWKMNEYKAVGEATSSDINISVTPTLRHEFSLCRVSKKSKCMRSFDRRPSSSAGGGVQISEPPAEAHHQDHQGQASVGATAAAAAATAAQYQSPQMAAETTMSSFLGDHDGYPSQSYNDSSAMLVDYDEFFWNIDGFWDS